MKRRARRPLRDYIIALLLILAIIWLGFLLWNIIRKESIARHAADDAKQELAALEERNATLEQNLADLKTSRGQEASYRENFGVARPGEEVIIVVPPPEGDDQMELPWWRKFLGFFGL